MKKTKTYIFLIFFVTIGGLTELPADCMWLCICRSIYFNYGFGDIFYQTVTNLTHSLPPTLASLQHKHTHRRTHHSKMQITATEKKTFPDTDNMKEKKWDLYHFLAETKKKTSPLLFNCIFFGAKVIINFAQGDYREWKIYKNVKQRSCL